MAITKEINFFGFPTNDYVKITWALIKEDKKDEEWNKLYSVELQVDRYTNDTKEYHYSQEIYKIEDLYEEELNFAKFYEKLKTNDKFNWYTDE